MAFKLKIKTAKELAAEKAEALGQAEAQEADDFLRSTDWMVIRELEGVKAMPIEVKARRTSARVKADKKKRE